MNQGPRWVRLIEKSRGQKSRAVLRIRIRMDPQDFGLLNPHDFGLLNPHPD
jgi:hypothetical protein